MSKLNDIKVKVEIEEIIGSPNEIKELKAKKQGELTPKEILRITLNDLINGSVEELIIISKDKDNKATVGWSSAEVIEVFGMLEMARLMVTDGYHEMD